MREAIAHAIDKQTIIDRVLRGLGAPADAMSPSANPAWMPEIPEDERFTFDLDRANQILDEAGYEDTDGDGVREMPGGGQPLRLRYAVRSESPTLRPPIGRVHLRLARATSGSPRRRRSTTTGSSPS